VDALTAALVAQIPLKLIAVQLQRIGVPPEVVRFQFALPLEESFDSFSLDDPPA